MKKINRVLLTFVVLSLSITGCEKTAAPIAPSATNTETSKKDTHAHGEGDHHHHGAGPNGGVIFDLGKDHAEFTVDHPAKSCTVLFLDGDDEKAKPLPVAAKELTLTTKETKTADGKVVPTMTITLSPTDEKDGKASKFTGTDPNMELVADHAGTVLGEVDGKPAQGEFKEE